MDHFIDGHRVQYSNVANIENEHQFNRIDNVNHVHDENESSQASHPQHYHHHVHNVPGTSKISNISHGQVLTTTNPPQAPSSGTAYVPYYHSNQPYSEEGSFGLLLSEQQRQLQHQNNKHSNQENIHSLPVGTTVGLGGIQMNYYQNRANSIEVPPNVTLPNSSHQTHIHNMNENNPSGVHSLSHPMHSSSFMHHQLSSSQQNSDILNQTHPSGMQILQGQDGSSVPLDTSGMIKIKRWKIFPGRNRFFCDGRFVMAKEPAVFAFTIILLCGTFASFVYFDCHYLGSHVSWAMPICGVLLFLFVLSTLLRTTFTDPGIIPRATPEEALAFEQFSCGNPSPTYRPPPRTKEVIIRNQPVKLKYCFTCKILRPPRASHCSLCDNCVERFDHHCPWVGNCVGRRNYRYFYMFIVSLAILTVYVFACVVTHLTLLKNETSISDAIKATPASMIVAIICFFSMWSIIGLAGFHTYLILNNLTTNEDIKGSFSSKRSNSIKNPYTGSSCENCVEILCSPLTPSLLKSRTYVYCDEQNYISRRRRKSTSSSAGDSPIPPPPVRTGPYPIAPSYQGISNSMSGFPLEHDHQNAQYILQHHQQRQQQQQQQQQQINRNSHSMQNMAGSFNGPTPPMSIREQIQQHRTHSINNCPDHSSQIRYDCSPIDSKNIQTNVYYNQNMNRLPNEYVGDLASTVPNQVSVAYQHKNCGNVTSQNKHFSS